MFPGFGQPAEPKREQEARIGVFICHCGHNIAGYLDITAMVESARRLPSVIVAQDSLFACSSAGLAAIREAVAHHRLNRIVVASCTPRTHEPLFQTTCEEAGLNRYLFELVNIRDQCSWVHMDDRGKATAKAQDLIAMGVARAALLRPLVEAETPVQPAAVVIGGGITGMTAALSLARRSYAVTLVERKPELGGQLRHLDTLYPTGADARALAERRLAEVSHHPQIEVLTGSDVVDVTGHIGSYEITVHSRRLGMELSIQAGVIVVATGAQELKPAGAYHYGQDRRVLTQGELEGLLFADRAQPGMGSSEPDADQTQASPVAQPALLRTLDPGSIVMIQCVGARDESRSYCGRTCCLTAMKNAMRLKARNPATEIHILYRDVEAYGTHFEDYYSAARRMGIVFSRYTVDDPPLVQDGKVLVFDELLGARLSIPFDLLVLSTPQVPSAGASELAKMLKVPVDEHGFFLEAHVKLRPLEAATDGVYLCGSAHWPAHLDEAISQGSGAAARAATVLSRDRIRSSGMIARVNEPLCRGCERCLEVCEFSAIDLTDPERPRGSLGRPGQAGAHRQPAVARVNPVLCKGCGACAVVCPTGAIEALHFTREQVTAMIQAAMGEVA